MHPDQLRKLIRNVLAPTKLYSESAEELLMLTAAAESLCGEYIYQIGGPARGIFQMEPATERDIWTSYLKYRPKLMAEVNRHKTRDGNDLVHNLAYQIMMARIHYLRVPKKLPKPDDTEGMARYWKKYYNTSEGKGNKKEAINKYKEFAWRKTKLT